MTKDLLTQAAQKEAEGLYPDVVWWADDGEALGTQSRQTGTTETIRALRAAHVKCALLYSERAAGLVEAARLPHNTVIWNDPKFAGRWIAVPEEDFTTLRAALHAFNSQT